MKFKLLFAAGLIFALVSCQQIENGLRELSRLSLAIVPDYDDGSISCFVPGDGTLSFLVDVEPERYIEELQNTEFYCHTVTFSRVVTKSAEPRDEFTSSAEVSEIFAPDGEVHLAVKVNLDTEMMQKLTHSSYAVSFKVSDSQRTQSVSTDFTSVTCHMEGPSTSGILERLPGVWELSEIDSQPVMTNDICVREYGLDGGMSVTYSSYDSASQLWIWHCGERGGYSISGNRITERFPGTEEQYDMLGIDGSVQKRYVYGPDVVATYRRVADSLDYKTRILGLWKGVSMTGDETFGDSNHLWEYHEDGTFTYYERNRAGQWVPSKDIMNEYFVHGDLLITRWQEPGEEIQYEWWNIESIENDRMVWNALRRRDDGSIFKTTFEFVNVNQEAESRIRSNIVGTWKLTALDGRELPTDERTVYVYKDMGTKYTSMSKRLADVSHRQWSAQTMSSYSIFGNQITEFSGNEYTHTTVIDINAINFEYIVDLKVKDGRGVAVNRCEVCTRVDDTIDYENLILGLWQGVSMSGDETFGNENHRWEFERGGKYKYYTKDEDGDWVADDSFCEYYVRGGLLNFRWYRKDNPECFFENWDVQSIDDELMTWSALRKNEDGATFVTTMTMKRVTE